MIMLDFDHNSKTQVEEAARTISEHMPIQYFKTYFDRENLLLTDYRETECYNALAIMKSYDGSFIVAKHCNCGYGGTGPHNTTAILGILGVPQNTAENYAFYNGAIELYFDMKGNLIPEKTNLINIFESRTIPCPFSKINLRNIDYFNAKERTFYLINPLGDAMYTLLQLLNVMEPTMFTYFIGSENTKHIDLSYIMELHNYDNSRKYPSPYYPFVQIKGNHFDVICLINQKSAKAFISNIAAYLGLPCPYSQITIGGLTCLIRNTSTTQTKRGKILSFMHEIRDNYEVYEQLPLETKRRGLLL